MKKNLKLEMDVQELTGHLTELCSLHRIDLAGAIALPCPLPHGKRWLEWVAADRHGQLEYLVRDPEGRVEPTRKNPTARSLLVFAQRYTDGWPAQDDDPSAGGSASAEAPWTDRVSRYARGLDYHDILLRDIKCVLKGLRQAVPGFTAYASTDTGPYLEREYAWLAGLGFLGHNRCLIHEKLGSGLFLGVALTNLEVNGLPSGAEPQPEPLFAVQQRRLHRPVMVPWQMCGSCTACLDACPTRALDPEKGLDARLCLSTWTIEWQGQPPAGQDSSQGELLFGCDICQSVCPWNRRAAKHRDSSRPPLRSEYAPREDHAELTLADLAVISDDEFRARFRKTPIWRCHPEGIRRNARTVLKNLGEVEK